MHPNGFVFDSSGQSSAAGVQRRLDFMSDGGSAAVRAGIRSQPSLNHEFRMGAVGWSS